MPAPQMALTGRRIKQSLMSVLPNRNKLNTLSAEYLLSMLTDSGISGYLNHRCHGTFPIRNTWKRRFVILAHSAVYVYDDAKSKGPRSCLSLLGYNCVRRVEADKSCQWAFAIASGDDTDTTERFDCSSDEERLEWMRLVKVALCKANNVVPRKQSLVEYLDAEYYKQLEEPVFELKVTRIPDAATSPEDAVFKSYVDISDDEDDDDDGDGYSSDEGCSSSVGIWSRLHRKGAVKRGRRLGGVSSVTTVDD